MTMIHESPADMRLTAIEAQLAYLVEEAQERSQMQAALSELAHDLSPMARQGMDSVASFLEDAEERGYLDFVRGGFAAADKVVTSFSKEDVDALGDNLVLILETVKEMTQPEIMQMLRATFAFAGEIDETSQPPRLFSILNRLRSPAARRGLYRLVFLLESLGTVHREDIERKATTR